MFLLSKKLIVGFILITLHFAVDGSALGDKDALPNVVYILADDMGYGDIQHLNKQSQIATPYLNQLCAQGIVFTDAHSGSAVCSPTRYGILTGRYCFRTALKREALVGLSPPLIEPDRFTIADLLKAAGYRTAVIGKWHLGLGWATKDKNDRITELRPDFDSVSERIDFTERKVDHGPGEAGFDYSYIIPASLDMPPYTFIENGYLTDTIFHKIKGSKEPRGNMWRQGIAAGDFKLENALDAIIAKADRFLKNAVAENTPFFLYLPLTSPHTPWLPAKKFNGSSGAGTYGDFVQHTDDAVGRILRTLDSLQLNNNTIVVFTSDNGADWRPEDKSVFPQHQANYIYRGGKSDVWEGGHRVPFIVRWPGKVKAGGSTGQMICLTDMLATAAALTGQKLPAQAGPDSFNFLPVLLDQKFKGTVRQTIIHHSIDGTFAIRQGKWKYIDSGGSGGWSMRTEKPSPLPGQLYDLQSDPGETTNLYEGRREIVSQMKGELERQKLQGYTRDMSITPGRD